MDQHKLLCGKIKKCRFKIRELDELLDHMNHIIHFMTKHLNKTEASPQTCKNSKQLQQDLRTIKHKCESKLKSFEHKHKQKYGYIPYFKCDIPP